MTDADDTPGAGQVLLYTDAAGDVRVRLDGRTVWLTQRQLAELYQVSVPTINEHIKGIISAQEVDSGATIRNFRTVQIEGQREVARLVEHYALDMILAVGYRVRSARGTAFRRWASEQLSELVTKGFVLDDERISAGRTIGAEYFDELLARIRDIRASERLFYRKVTEIYATSIDYDPKADVSREFFAVVQNKLHHAVHGPYRARADSRARQRRPPQHGTDQLEARSCRTDPQTRRRRREKLPVTRRTDRAQSNRHDVSGLRRGSGAAPNRDAHG